MQTTTIIYLILAVLFSSAASWLLYFYKNNAIRKIEYVLFALRSISIFLVLLLLINPIIERNKITNEFPILSVLVDNSLSIKYFNKEKEVLDIVKKIQSNTALKEKFDVQFYQFGKSLNIIDSINFNASQTNIYNAISSVEGIDKNSVAPIVLISDGNQTNGNLYPYISTKKNVFPIVIGDTLTQTDVRISQLNVNKYSYLQNKFPVEITALYEGDQAINTQLTIAYKGKAIYSKNLVLSPDKATQTITTNVLSTKEGVQYYTVSLKTVTNEKNTDNNTKSFSVEVLNEQTKILLLTSVLHPDLGALKKAIETNKQRSIIVRNINDFKENIADYQLVVLYQPTAGFEKVFEKIEALKSNYFVITGTNTNWNFLNEMQSNYAKNSIRQTEDYVPIFNNGFLTFSQKDISFETFSPLKDAFGTITLKTKFDALLYQNISGIETKMPLFATFENGEQKSAVLFGEGIWKWRASSFINSNSFEDFDAFIGNMMQYLSSTKKRDRLTLNYDKLFAANTPITISAFYVDKNFQFDARANLNLILTNTESNVSQNVPFSLQQNSFEAILGNIPSGNYQFEVVVENQDIKRFGKFKISQYQIEEQFTKANQKELQLLASNTEGKVHTTATTSKLIAALLSDARYNIIQKSEKINQYLIGWKLVLLFLLLSFSTEWFLRKYDGKI